MKLTKCLGFSLLLIFCAVAARAEQHRKNTDYPNVITANIPHITVLNFSFLNIGMEYERFLDPKRRFSLNAAAYAGVLLPGQSPSSGTDLYAAPGFRYHPVYNSTYDFSVGLQIAFGSLSITERGRSKSGDMTAILLQSDWNFFPLRHGVVGLHFALGRNFSQFTDNGFFFQAGLKIGGRF